jgi:hypothetical protein
MHDLGSAQTATRPAPDRHPWLHSRTDRKNGERFSRISDAPSSQGAALPKTNPVVVKGVSARSPPVVVEGVAALPGSVPAGLGAVSRWLQPGVLPQNPIRS